MFFDVDVDDDIWFRHHNQIRRRHCRTTSWLESAPSLPPDIQLDTLAIPAGHLTDDSLLQVLRAPQTYSVFKIRISIKNWSKQNKLGCSKVI
nr:unnamed protein product [Spirometra erinaceieuropaei]